MRKSSLYLGKFECSADGELIAGMPGTVRIKYTVGKYGIDDGGSILILRHGVTDFQKINLTDKTAPGYSAVYSDAHARFTVEEWECVRPYESGIRIKVTDGFLKEGDRVEFVMGDRSGGSFGITVQTVAEKEHLIMLAVDPIGSGRYEKLPDVKFLRIKNGSFADYDVILPSTAEKGKEFDIRIRVVDDYGNRCEDFSGELILDAPDGLKCERTVRFEEADKGAKTIKGMINTDGTYKIRSVMKDYNIKKTSNICKTVAEGALKLYWGDMHAQNAVASGIGSMDDALSFAKDIGALDFTGWQGNDFEISDKNWELVKKKIEEYNTPNKFVVFSGYEWSGITPLGGDHNIYFKTDKSEICRSSRWLWKPDEYGLPQGREDDGSDCSPISELWERFRGRDDVMAIPHVGGRYGNFDFFNPEFTSVIEIYSHHGIFEWYIEEAIKRRMKVGFIAASDDHTSRVGLSYPMGTNSSDIGATFDVRSGLTAVYAENLTRDGIWNAIKARRCYAATSSRIILDFSCNGHMMGEEAETDELPHLKISLNAPSPIDRVEIFRGLELIHTEYCGNYKREDRAEKIKIVYSGVSSRLRKKSTVWSGNIYIKHASILNAENYSVDNAFEGIKGYDRHCINFVSKTSGDEDGVIITLVPEPKKECSILFQSKQANIEVPLSEILKSSHGVTFDVGEVNRKVCFSKEYDSDVCDTLVEYTDTGVTEGVNQYYVKVYQKDGNRAWSSPIFINFKEKK